MLCQMQQNRPVTTDTSSEVPLVGISQLGLKIPAVQLITLDFKNTIQAGAIILKRDLRSQLQQLFFREFIPQASVQIIRNIRWRADHCVGQFNHQTLDLIELCQVIAYERAQLLISQSCFSADGRIDVYSKRTADSCRCSHFCQLNVTQRYLALAAEASFHRNAAPNQTRQTHLQFDRREFFAKHLAHRAVKPTQVPRRLLLF